MESSLAVLHKIADAKQLAEGLARVKPNEAPWSTLFTLLEAYEGKVRDHWPLTPEEKEAVRLGWFSIKNIEEVFRSFIQPSAKSRTPFGIAATRDLEASNPKNLEPRLPLARASDASFG